MISYKRFIDKIGSKGLSLNQLRLKGVITQHTYEQMINDKPVGIDKIAKLCVHLDIGIEDVVEIKRRL